MTHSLWTRPLLPLLLAGVCFAARPVCRGAEPGEAELLAGADARIEQHRKGDVTVVVLDSAGRPVPGATISVEQTRHAFLFGCNIFTWETYRDAQLTAEYRRRFAELWNYATLPFYWPQYEPQRGRPQHERAERVARWCQEHGIAAKGHPLLWNLADPAWLPDDPAEVRRLQLGRIDDCVSHFAGLIDRWDVVNEATHYDRAGFMKAAPKITTAWKQAGQVEFTRECLLHARKAHPQATLLVNDYRTDPPYERLIEQLTDAGGRRLYDAIGIQSHMHGGAWPTAQIWEVCQRFARFGVPLHATETTILSGDRNHRRASGAAWPSTPEGEAYQAREVVRFYTLLFSHPAMEAITWWDLSDRSAWQGAPAGLLRADMTPKPAYDELLKRVKGTWWTRATLHAGPDGTATLRGFLGLYRLSVTAQGKTATAAELALTKSPGRWVIKLPSE